MALRSKYQRLIDTANQRGVTNLKVREENNVMYIDGDAPSDDIKNELWDVYNQIDPDYRAGDLVLNINSLGGTSSSEQEYEVVKGDSLSKIGAQYGVPWKEIYEANRDKIKDPDLIQPGWKLKIPAKKG